ncbi:MAG TPA: hypothetical protein DEP53_02995 [Bacteroidetes bacterium]|nr:hypothetical protein [Bacteroidota bacterium]
MNNASDYFDFISKGDHNVYVSLINDAPFSQLFLGLDFSWHQHTNHIAKLPDISTKDAYFVSATLFLVAHRQFRNAYYLLLRRMSYDALLPFRVAMESVGFGFQISKDASLAEVWANKTLNQKEFRIRLRDANYPPEMPYGVEIKKAIDIVNEYWAHPNINYASQTVGIGTQEIRVYSYDQDEVKYRTVLLSFLQDFFRCLAVLRSTMEGRYAVYLTSTGQSVDQLGIQLEALKSRFRSSIE